MKGSLGYASFDPNENIQLRPQFGVIHLACICNATSTCSTSHGQILPQKVDEIRPLSTQLSNLNNENILLKTCISYRNG
jgi:hypothetical protein